MSKNNIVERYRELCVRRQGLIGRLAALETEQLATKPAAGRWSVLQILYHTYLAEKGTLGYINKKLQFSPSGLPNATAASAVRTVLLQLVLASPLKFRAPAGLDVVPDQPDLAEIAAEWEQTSSDFGQLLQKLEEHQMRWQLFKHPVIGRIDMTDTIKFMTSHFIHHQKQIERLIS